MEGPVRERAAAAPHLAGIAGPLAFPLGQFELGRQSDQFAQVLLAQAVRSRLFQHGQRRARG